MPYICVSGNTGAGKSTLLARVGESLERNRHRVLLVDESTLHHRLLQHMFDDPSSWAFVMQMNFLIQRIATVMESSLDEDTIMIMERSPSEDPLFFERLARRGHIDADLVPQYYSLSSSLRSRIPEPIGYVYVDATPDICLARLHAAVASGSRPVELEGHALEQYVHDMGSQYAKWRAAMPSSVKIHDVKVSRYEEPAAEDVEACIASIERWIS